MWDSPSGRLEIIWRDAVKKFLEFLDLLLANRASGLVVVLVGDEQARFREHRLLDIDRHPHPERDGYGVRRPCRHLDIAVEDQVGVEGTFLQIYDPHLLERMPKRGNDISDQVVSQRARRLDALLLERNRGGLRLADPNGEIPVAVGLSQQQYRLVLRLFNTNTDDPDLTHLRLPSAGIWGPVQRRTSCDEAVGASLILSGRERRAQPTSPRPCAM